MDALEELSNEELSQLIQRAHDVYQKRMEGVIYYERARDNVDTGSQKMVTIISIPGKSVTLDLSPYHCMLLRSYLKWCKFIELPASCNYNARCQGVAQPLVLTIGDIYFDQVREIDQDDFAKNFQRELECPKNIQNIQEYILAYLRYSLYCTVKTNHSEEWVRPWGLRAS